MSAARRSFRNATLTAVASVVCLGHTASAGPIAAGSVPGGPTPLSTITTGTPVDASSLITNQYSSVGLDASMFKNLSLAALGSVGGTTAFIPTVASSSGFNLDYNGFVGFQIVNPADGSATTTHHISVEFVGQHADQGFLYGMTTSGGILASTAADDGIGPHGGHLATLDVDGIGLFAAWSLYDGHDTKVQFQNYWGLAMIDINGEAPPPGDHTGRTPEPTTLALACAGLAGMASAAWKRRKSVRS